MERKSSAAARVALMAAAVFLVIYPGLILCKRIAPSSTEPAAFKDFVDRTVSAEKIDGYLRYLTAEPHVAASPRNDKLAQYIAGKWKEFGLEDVTLAAYDVLLSFPRSIEVELVSPHHVRLEIKEKGYAEDPDTMNPEVGIPYNAYSRSGDVTAPLVYANGGNPEDYDLLETRGIDVKGKIALVRYSSPYSYRGFKALTAEKRGLAGLLIYSDPKEDGYARGPVFPAGPWGPPSHIQRGGIPYDFIYPGDPLTPGWASKPDGRKLSLEEAKTIPRIISVPLSAENARPLLESLDGEEAPQDWQGALPITYRLADRQRADSVDEALEVLPGDIFHGDVICPFLPAEVEHSADIPVRDGAGELQFVPEAFDRPLVRGDIGMEEFQGHFFLNFGVENLVNPAHSTLAQVLDDLVSPGEGRPGGQFLDRHLKSLGEHEFFFRRQGRGAIPAEPRAGGVFRMTLGAFHRGAPSAGSFSRKISFL